VRGEVLTYNDTVGSGLITGADGLRYAFDRSSLESRTSVQPGDSIDFVPMDDDTATAIYVLADQSVSKLPLNSKRSPWGHFVYCLTQKYADGTGRATRAEYWSFVLFFWLGMLAPAALGLLVDALLGFGAGGDMGPFRAISGLLMLIVLVGLVLPSFCVLIRRFHDVGLTGWLVLIGAIPYVGGLFNLVVSVLGSQPHANKHGPLPGTVERSTAEIFS